MIPREKIEKRVKEYAWVGDMNYPTANYKAGA